MAGAAGCGGERGRKDCGSPERCPVGTDRVAARHLGAMAVYIRALTVAVIEGRCCATAGNQQRTAPEDNRIGPTGSGACLGAELMINRSQAQTIVAVCAGQGRDGHFARIRMGRVRIGDIRIGGPAGWRGVAGSTTVRRRHRAGQVAIPTAQRNDRRGCHRILVASQAGGGKGMVRVWDSVRRGTDCGLNDAVNMFGRVSEARIALVHMRMTPSAGCGGSHAGVGADGRRETMTGAATLQIAGLAPLGGLVAAAGERCTVTIGVAAGPCPGCVTWIQSPGFR